MTTTISIHVPLTEKVLEGLEDKKEYVFEKSNGNCVLRTRRWVQNDFSVNKNKTFINLLVRRSFTEEEVKEEAKNRYPEKWVNSISKGIGIHRQDLGQNERFAYIQGFNLAFIFT